MLYHRLCRGLKDKGELVPVTEDILSKVDSSQDWYTSIYKYDENHKKQFDEKGSVAGIVDVQTDKLLWDFDSTNPDEARTDAVELLSRLKKHGITDEQTEIYFSGSKGFHVVLNTEEVFKPLEFKAITKTLAQGLKTYDSVVSNPSRIIRVPHTKHPKTGLFKTRLSAEELKESIEDIKNTASQEWDAAPASPKVKTPVTILSLKDVPEQVKATNVNLPDKPDLTLNPLKLPPWKLALTQGFYPSGTRNSAMMIVASTLKNKGFDGQQSYFILKSMNEKQSDRFGQDKYTKDQMWNEVINVVYGPHWNGGMYSYENAPEELKGFLTGLDIDDTSDANSDPSLVEQVSQGFGDFVNYANKIDEYTMQFGIPSLDNKLKIRKGHLIYLLSPPGGGKCHGKGTEIVMANGDIKKVEDVKVGDKIMGDDSTPRNVLSLARGIEKMYRVHTNDGSYVVNESHILSLKTTARIRGLDKGEVINISVKDYIKQSDHFKRRTMGYRVPLHFSEQEVKFDPYLVGSWLGDGTRTKPEITNVDVAELSGIYEQIAVNSGLEYKVKYPENRAPSHTFTTARGLDNPFLNYIRDEFQGKKYIPQEYKVNSRENRMRLLAGLIDTDGYYSKEKDTYYYTTKDEELAKDIRFLVRSLGMKCSMTKKTKSIKSTGFSGEYYQLYIVGDFSDCPIQLERKKQIFKKKQRSLLNYRIKVEEMDVDAYYGFELDGNHLYCLSDLSVTHNTSFAITLLNNMSRAGTHCYFASYDMYKHNVYQKLIQRHTRLSEEELYDVFREGDTERINGFREILEKHYGNVTFCFKSGQSIAEMKATIRESEERTGKLIDLVIVDYHELVQTKSSDPTVASAEVAQGLREIANEGRVVVGLLQPNKMSSKPNEPLTSYNAAKGSSAIAQSATAILTSHRPGLDSTNNNENDNFFCINCVKNRNGSLFALDFHWDGPTQTIREMEDCEKGALKELRDKLKEKSILENSGGHLI